MKPIFKCMISGVLSLGVTINVVTIVSVHAEESFEPYLYMIFAASSDKVTITVNTGIFSINGNVAINGAIVSNGNMNININNSLKAMEGGISLFGEVKNTNQTWLSKTYLEEIGLIFGHKNV